MAQGCHASRCQGVEGVEERPTFEAVVPKGARPGDAFTAVAPDGSQVGAVVPEGAEACGGQQQPHDATDVARDQGLVSDSGVAVR